MASSSRIIGAEDVTDVRRFHLDELRQGTDATHLMPGHRNRQPADTPAQAAPSGPPPGFAQGMKRGLEEGFRRGVDSAREQLNRDQAARLQAIADDFARRTDALHDAMATALAQVRRDLAEDAIALALELARQVIRTQLRELPQSVEAVVQEAIDSLVDERASFVLHLCPQDADLMGPILAPVLQDRSARIALDPQMQAGGCRITSPAGEVDATLPTRWRRVLAAIGQPDLPMTDTTES